METAFDPDLIHAIFKLVWEKKLLIDVDKNEGDDNLELEVVGGASKKSRTTAEAGSRLGPLHQNSRLYLVIGHTEKMLSKANSNALKLSSELIRLFVAEAINRAAIIAEAEGVSVIDASHMERILPQLLLDF